MATDLKTEKNAEAKASTTEPDGKGAKVKIVEAHKTDNNNGSVAPKRPALQPGGVSVRADTSMFSSALVSAATWEYFAPPPSNSFKVRRRHLDFYLLAFIVIHISCSSFSRF